MSARFRIRTPQGQELSFASHEMFAEFVRSGELSPDDVVYDAETREWSSALTHPVVLQIEEEEEEEEPNDDRGPPEEESSESDVGLELAPPVPQRTPEEEAEAFVKKMEAERASEEPGIQGFKMEQGSSGLVGGFADGPAKAPQAPAGAEAGGDQGEGGPTVEPRRPEPRGQAPPLEPPVRKMPKKAETKAPGRKKRAAGRRYAPLVIVSLVVVAAGVYLGPELIESAGESRTGQDSVELPPRPEPLIPNTEEALRERAQERFLTTTRALLSDLPPIPESWLSGSYLAAPSDYPEVRQAWNQVLTRIREIRAGDNERYRAGYTRALDDARVDGTARNLRLTAAVARFQGNMAPRSAHYDRVEALATVALQAHDTLVEAEGTIAYEPAASTPVSGDPVIEAVGRNPEAQALLDEVLDMVLAELEEPDGPGRASNLGEWIWDGILNAVTT